MGIYHVIEEGRLIYQNLTKAIAYTLTSSVAKVMPFVVATTLQIPLPLSLTLVLLIDIFTDFLPSIFLAAYEKPEIDLNELVPRLPKRDRFLTKRLFSHTLLQIGLI